MNLIRNVTFDNDILFVDGHCGVGKSLISKTLEAFEGVEKSQEDEPFQFAQWLYRLKKIDKQTAVTLMRIWADRYLYNLMVGRNINTRPTDVTSVETYPFKQKYEDRKTMGEHYDAERRVKEERPIFQNMTQNALIEASVYFEAFGDRLKIIYINRNEIDTIESVVKSGFGYRMGCDPTEVSLTFNHNGYSVPYFAHSWPDDYIMMDSKDRVAKWIRQETEEVNRSYNYLREEYKENVLFIDFEQFVQFPYVVCDRIEQFIGRPSTNKLKEVLTQQNCPRTL